MSNVLIGSTGNRYVLNESEEKFVEACSNKNEGLHCIAYALAINLGDMDWLSERLEDAVIYSSQMSFDILEGKDKVNHFIRRKIELIQESEIDLSARVQLAFFEPGRIDQGVYYDPGFPCCMVYQREGKQEPGGLGEWRFWLKLTDSENNKVVELHSGRLPRESGIIQTQIFPGFSTNLF